VTGCAGCGHCCDPVTLDADLFARIREHARRDDFVERYPEEGHRRNLLFIAQHWHPTTAWHEDGVTVKLGLRCDQFDPQARRCTAYEDRPPVCRDYPWYGDKEGTRCARASSLYPECSYLLDIPPAFRPEGSRPLIPITPVGA
jgi:Fe-S-cluster containining protein